MSFLDKYHGASDGNKEYKDDPQKSDYFHIPKEMWRFFADHISMKENLPSSPKKAGEMKVLISVPPFD